MMQASRFGWPASVCPILRFGQQGSAGTGFDKVHPRIARTELSTLRGFGEILR